MRNIIIIGNGGHAKSCCDVIELEKKFKIIGFISSDKNLEIKSNKYLYLGTDKNLINIRKRCDSAFVAIGHIKNNSIRKKIFRKLYELKFKTPKIVSPRSYVSKSSKILEGTIIMHGAIVNAGATIQKNCIINSNALIEHDCSIGENCHISTGVVVNGHTWIGDNSFIGSNSTIQQSVKIEKNCFVNANIFINKDLKKNTRVIKKK